MSGNRSGEFDILTLKNGIRIVHKQIQHTSICHCGLMFDIGSRDELNTELGIAHFWEHMAFKGTQKRKSFHIINRLDVVGGELNAYTTKEKICFHASVHQDHLERTIELLNDIGFYSTFPENEIEKERGVIVEEMAMYRDNPDDSLQDDFDGVIFKNHILGENILGTEESVKNISRNDFLKFIDTNLSTDKIVFSIISSFSSAKVFKIAQKYFDKIPRTIKKNNRVPFLNYTPSIVEVKRSISQAHCAIGTTAYSGVEEDRIGLFLLNNILGGPAMTSRFNLELREKKGYVYGVDSSFISFKDTGMWVTYFATEPKQLDKSIQIIKNELKKITDAPLSEKQLSIAKQQVKGQLAISEDRISSLMLVMAKSLLDLDRIDTMQDVFDLIDQLTTHKLHKIAKDIFDFERMSILKYIPVK